MADLIVKEDFQKLLDEKFPDESITVLEYSGASKPGTYICNKCQTEASIFKMSALLRKKHCCNNCFIARGTGERTKEYKEKSYQLAAEHHEEVLGFGYNEKFGKPTIKTRCLKCGQTTERQLTSFVRYNHNKCPYCDYNGKKMNSKGFSVRIPDEYELLEDYKGTETKILIRHKSCGFIWKTTPHNLIDGCGCPKCALSRSRGEKKIMEVLDKYKVNYQTEKSFDWSDKKRFDFYLPEHNFVIEFNGAQHYQDFKHFRGGEPSSCKEIRDKDMWKMIEALKHGLYYMEIPYTDFNDIEQILVQRLSLRGVGSKSNALERESTLTGEKIV